MKTGSEVHLMLRERTAAAGCADSCGRRAHNGTEGCATVDAMMSRRGYAMRM